MGGQPSPGAETAHFKIMVALQQQRSAQQPAAECKSGNRSCQRTERGDGACGPEQHSCQGATKQHAPLKAARAPVRKLERCAKDKPFQFPDAAEVVTSSAIPPYVKLADAVLNGLPQRQVRTVCR